MQSTAAATHARARRPCWPLLPLRRWLLAAALLALPAAGTDVTAGAR
jgi:hypothetical protein